MWPFLNQGYIWDLQPDMHSNFSGDPINIPDLHYITPPMPSTISVALFMRPIVAAMLH